MVEMDLKIKGWDHVLDQDKQQFFLDLEKVLDKYELIGVCENNIMEG